MLALHSAWTTRPWTRPLLFILGLTFITYTLLRGITSATTASRLAGSDHEAYTPRIMRLSMLYGSTNFHYKRALENHRRHASKWGEELHVLGTDLSKGVWSKPIYMLERLINELEKPAVQRVAWLMWVDADSIVINPSIPASIFLPPDDLDSLHLVATRDHNGLNTGVFFLRVHQWSVSFLLQTLAVPICRSDFDAEAVSADQDAMATVLNETTGGYDGAGYHSGVAYLPRPWINSYQFTHGFEGKRGDFIVHFPGLKKMRWQRMAEWLDLLDVAPEQWDVPLLETSYWNDTRSFWAEYRTLSELAQEPVDPEQETEAVRNARLDLQSGLHYSSDDLAGLEKLRQRLAAEQAVGDQVG